MAKKAIQKGRLNIRQVCEAFTISRTCYRYKPKLSEENTRIAGWLVRLCTEQRSWGFGLCFLYLRNIKGFGWNHKRVVSDLLRTKAEPADQAQTALGA